MVAISVACLLGYAPLSELDLVRLGILPHLVLDFDRARV